MNIELFTDGSFIKTKDGDKSGYGIHFPNKELEDVSRPFTHQPLTNQRSELYAILKALFLISTKLGFDKVKSVLIYSDSEYSIKSITEWLPKWKQNNWKTAGNKDVKNLDIIKPIAAIMEKNPKKIYFQHVRSHTGGQDMLSKGNDVVDKLAKDGAFKKNN